MFDLRFVVGVALGGLCLFAVASVFFVLLPWFGFLICLLGLLVKCLGLRLGLFACGLCVWVCVIVNFAVGLL